MRKIINRFVRDRRRRYYYGHITYGHVPTVGVILLWRTLCVNRCPAAVICAGAVPERDIVPESVLIEFSEGARKTETSREEADQKCYRAVKTSDERVLFLPKLPTDFD